MKVQCPSCGKAFDVPRAQEGRMLRCLCRSLFRAKAIEEDAFDIADMASVVDPDETQETKRKVSTPTTTPTADESPESSISEQEMDTYLDSLKKSRAESGYTSNIKSKSQSSAKEIPQYEIQSLELSKETPRPTVEEIAPPEEPEILQSESAEAFVTPSQVRPVAPTTPIAWYKDFRVLAGTFAMLLIVLVSALTLVSKKTEEKKEDPYLAQLLTPKATPPAPVEPPLPVVKREAPVVTAAPPTPHPVAAPAQPSLYQRLLKEFYEGRFENVVRLGSSAKEMNAEERALHFEALIQRANDNRARISEIKNQILEERKRSQAAVYLRSLASAIFAGFSDTKELLQGIETLKNLAITRSQDPLVFTYLGFGYAAMERPDLMNQAWNDAMNLAPNFTWLVEQRIDRYFMAENFTKAAEMAERLRSLPGKEQRGLIRLARIALAQNREDIAMKYYRDALTIEEDAEIHLAIGQYYLAKNPKQAIKEFESALKLDPDTLVKRDLFFNKGKAHCKEKDLASAVISFNKAVTLDPHYYQAFFERGNCQLLSGQAGAAGESFEAALSKNPNNSSIWMTYGYTLLRLSKARAAVGALRRSLDIKETDKAHYYMALALIQLGKRQEGIAHAKQAYKLNPKNAEARALASRGQ